MDALLGMLDAVVDVGWISFIVTLAAAMGLLLVDRRPRPPRIDAP